MPQVKVCLGAGETTLGSRGSRWSPARRGWGLGGAGTPQLQELALCELAIARGQHTSATRAAVADALDLCHRLEDHRGRPETPNSRPML